MSSTEEPSTSVQRKSTRRRTTVNYWEMANGGNRRLRVPRVDNDRHSRARSVHPLVKKAQIPDLPSRARSEAPSRTAAASLTKKRNPKTIMKTPQGQNQASNSRIQRWGRSPSIVLQSDEQNTVEPRKSTRPRKDVDYRILADRGNRRPRVPGVDNNRQSRARSVHPQLKRAQTPDLPSRARSEAPKRTAAASPTKKDPKAIGKTPQGQNQASNSGIQKTGRSSSIVLQSDVQNSVEQRKSSRPRKDVDYRILADRSYRNRRPRVPEVDNNRQSRARSVHPQLKRAQIPDLPSRARSEAPRRTAAASPTKERDSKTSGKTPQGQNQASNSGIQKWGRSPSIVLQPNVQNSIEQRKSTRPKENVNYWVLADRGRGIRKPQTPKVVPRLPSCPPSVFRQNPNVQISSNSPSRASSQVSKKIQRIDATKTNESTVKTSKGQGKEQKRGIERADRSRSTAPQRVEKNMAEIPLNSPSRAPSQVSKKIQKIDATKTDETIVKTSKDQGKGQKRGIERADRSRSTAPHRVENNMAETPLSSPSASSPVSKKIQKVDATKTNDSTVKTSKSQEKGESRGIERADRSRSTASHRVENNMAEIPLSSPSRASSPVSKKIQKVDATKINETTVKISKDQENGKKRGIERADRSRSSAPQRVENNMAEIPLNSPSRAPSQVSKKIQKIDATKTNETTVKSSKDQEKGESRGIERANRSRSTAPQRVENNMAEIPLSSPSRASSPVSKKIQKVDATKTNETTVRTSKDQGKGQKRGIERADRSRSSAPHRVENNMAEIPLSSPSRVSSPVSKKIQKMDATKTSETIVKTSKDQGKGQKREIERADRSRSTAPHRVENNMAEIPSSSPSRASSQVSKKIQKVDATKTNDSTLKTSKGQEKQESRGIERADHSRSSAPHRVENNMAEISSNSPSRASSEVSKKIQKIDATKTNETTVRTSKDQGKGQKRGIERVDRARSSAPHRVEKNMAEFSVNASNSGSSEAPKKREKTSVTAKVDVNSTVKTSRGRSQSKCSGIQKAGCSSSDLVEEDTVESSFDALSRAPSETETKKNTTNNTSKEKCIASMKTSRDQEEELSFGGDRFGRSSSSVQPESRDSNGGLRSSSTVRMGVESNERVAADSGEETELSTAASSRISEAPKPHSKKRTESNRNCPNVLVSSQIQSDAEPEEGIAADETESTVNDPTSSPNESLGSSVLEKRRFPNVVSGAHRSDRSRSIHPQQKENVPSTTASSRALSEAPKPQEKRKLESNSTRRNASATATEAEKASEGVQKSSSNGPKKLRFANQTTAAHRTDRCKSVHPRTEKNVPSTSSQNRRAVSEAPKNHEKKRKESKTTRSKKLEPEGVCGGCGKSQHEDEDTVDANSKPLMYKKKSQKHIKEGYRKIICNVCKTAFHQLCSGLEQFEYSLYKSFHCQECSKKFGKSIEFEKVAPHRLAWNDESEAQNSEIEVGSEKWIEEFRKWEHTIQAPKDGEVDIFNNGNEFNEMFRSIKTKSTWKKISIVKNIEGLGMKMPKKEEFKIENVLEILGPQYEVDTIDVYAQSTFAMKLATFVEKMKEDPKLRKRPYNFLSLEFSGNEEMENIISPPDFVKNISIVDRLWSKGGRKGETLDQEHRPRVELFCLAGMEGSYTDFHIDFGGSSVYYHILRGQKIFYVAEPTEENLKRFAEDKLLGESKDWFGDRIREEMRRVVVNEGETLLIPAGWIHAVLTPMDSLVFGGNFLHSLNVEMQIKIFNLENTIRRFDGSDDKFYFPNFQYVHWLWMSRVLAEELKDANCVSSSLEAKDSNIWLACQTLVVEMAKWIKKDTKMEARLDEMQKEDLKNQKSMMNSFVALVKEQKRIQKALAKDEEKLIKRRIAFESKQNKRQLANDSNGQPTPKRVRLDRSAKNTHIDPQEDGPSAEEDVRAQSLALKAAASSDGNEQSSPNQKPSED